MLNDSAMAQLRQLKQAIHDSKDRAEGIVKGSLGRYGFVALDDGREIYLSPEQMQHLFPDDRIAVEVMPGEAKSGKADKPVARVERLLDSPLRTFMGRYVVRDNAHFVEPDLPRLNRWIFVPPKLRRAGEADSSGSDNLGSDKSGPDYAAKPNKQSRPNSAAKRGAQPQHGDYVRARITQHPFKDGKPQACIEAIIGNDDQKGVQARYALARFELSDTAPALIERDLLQPDAQTRRDLTALPLITIDGNDTRDMDDALYAEVLHEKADDAIAASAPAWKLTVAIADPSAWIKPDSELEKNIAARGTSTYLPGLCVPMLPEQLANDRCSLMPEVERLAVVCEMWIDAAGHIARYEFSEARVRSQAKLNYEQANDCLLATETATAPWSDSLRALHAVSLALQSQREREHLLLPERGEYRAQFDDNGKITGYQRQVKNAAHQLVEECMVATNRCAAHYLRDESAVFVSHAGFRAERRDNVAKLIAAELPHFTPQSVGGLNDYIALMHTVAAQKSELPLREILTRSLERSQFSGKPMPHFGMGLEAYATITSPIRKFNDYLTQRALKAKLRGAACAPLSAETIACLQDCSDRARQAAVFAQQWLDCDYLSRCAPESVWNGTIVHVTSSGFLVRLDETGIQGFVDTRHSGEKFSFDAVYMRLKSAHRIYELEQRIEVKLAAIDHKKHQIALQLATLPAASTDAVAPAASDAQSCKTIM